MVGMIPLLAVRGRRRGRCCDRALTVGKQFAGLPRPARPARPGASCARPACCAASPGSQRLLLSRGRHRPAGAAARRLFDEAEFLSPVRAARAVRLPPRPPVRARTSRASTPRIDYEPAESTTAMFGGNSNWRGPVWFPLNYLVISVPGALPPVLRRRPHRRVPDRLRHAGAARRHRRRPRRTGSSRSSCAARTAAGRASAGSTGCSTTRPGRTTCCSTSTSTATTAPGSAPRTRPAGRA